MPGDPEISVHQAFPRGDIKETSEKLANTLLGRRYLNQALLESQKIPGFMPEERATILCEIAEVQHLYGVDPKPIFKEVLLAVSPDTISKQSKTQVLAKIVDTEQSLGIEDFTADQALKELLPPTDDYYLANFSLAKIAARTGDEQEALKHIQRIGAYWVSEQTSATRQQYFENFTSIISKLVKKNGFLVAKRIIEQTEEHQDVKDLSKVLLARVALEQGILPLVENEIWGRKGVKTTTNSERTAIVLQQIALLEAERGMFPDALKTVDKLNGGFSKAESLIQLAIELHKRGEDPSSLLKKAEQIVAVQMEEREKIKKKDNQTYEYWGYAVPKLQAEVYSQIAVAYSKCGLDPNPLLIQAESAIDTISEHNSNWTDLARQEVANSLLEMGKYSELSNALKEITNPKIRTRIIVELAKDLATKKLTAEEISQLEKEDVYTLLGSNNKTVHEAVGFFNAGSLSTLDTKDRITPAVEISRNIGLAESAMQPTLSGLEIQSAQLSDDAKVALGIAREIYQTNEDKEVTKNYIEGLVATQPYEIITNNLLALFQAEEKNGNSGTARAIRILKGLLEVDNPKGQIYATQLAANESIPPHYREYLARKLFDTGYWDKELGTYLQDQLSSSTSGESEVKERQAQTIKSLIVDLGLTPDAPSYQAIEKPGLLKATTLEGRIAEIKEKKVLFEGKSRDQLVEMCSKNEELAQILYLLKAGEYRHGNVKDYSFDKFLTIIKSIHQISINNTVLKGFEAIVKGEFKPAQRKWFTVWDRLKPNIKTGFGLPKEEADKVMEDLTAGRPLVVGSERTFRFSTTIAEGSNYEQSLVRLNDVWSQELKSLLIARELGVNPATVNESLVLLGNVGSEQSLVRSQKLMKRLRISEGQIDLKNFQIIAKDLRNSLKDKYKTDKIERARIDELTDVHVVTEYLKDMLPDSDATAEWMSHLSESVVSLHDAEANRRKGNQTRAAEMELTFLDKNADFFRAIRFADSAQCCFNSNGEMYKKQTRGYIAKLNKDPLSFMMDLKESGSDTISGFIFGRMGVNPRTGRPVVMLNGIYAQKKSPALNDNIMQLIEQNIGKRLNAETVVIASMYGGKIDPPTGYQEVKDMELTAVRALSNDQKKPDLEVYDDIGVVANGDFKFKGYAKTV